MRCAIWGHATIEGWEATHHPLDHLLRRLRGVVVLGEGVLAVDDRLVRLQVRLAEEGVVAEEHDEHDQPDAPHVDRLVVRLLVAARADDLLATTDFEGRYGEYLLRKVRKVFPHLASRDAIDAAMREWDRSK